MTAAELAALMQRRARAVDRELQAATRQLGVEALATSRKLMTSEIYDKPVDVGPRSGKPKWRRTGQLRRGERVRSEASRYQAVLVNDQVYARRRHALDYAAIRAEARKKGNPAPKTDRTAHWRADTLAAMTGRAAELCREALDRALRNP